MLYGRYIEKRAFNERHTNWGGIWQIEESVSLSVAIVEASATLILYYEREEYVDINTYIYVSILLYVDLYTHNVYALLLYHERAEYIYAHMHKHIHTLMLHHERAEYIYAHMHTHTLVLYYEREEYVYIYEYIYIYIYIYTYTHIVYIISIKMIAYPHPMLSIERNEGHCNETTPSREWDRQIHERVKGNGHLRLNVIPCFYMCI